MTCKAARALMLECLTGTTPPDVRRALQAHLHTCAACRQEAQTLEETVTLLRAVPAPRLLAAYWGTFMAALERRFQHETPGTWRRLVRWLRNPRTAWSTAAATSALVVALGIALLVHPTNQIESPAPPGPTGSLHGLVTDSIVQSMPSMVAAINLWKDGLTAVEVSYEFPAGGE